MNIEKISVQKVFPIGPYMNVKIGVEASIDKEEDVKVAITDAEELLNDWFKNSYPNIDQAIVYAQGEPVADVFSGPIPKTKQSARNGQPVLMPPPPDIITRYNEAQSKGDITTLRNLEKNYNFTQC